MLHTIIDESDIFYAENHSNALPYSYKNVNNCIFEGTESKEGFILQRIISTNLEDYLNPKYILGDYLNLSK